MSSIIKKGGGSLIEAIRKDTEKKVVTSGPTETLVIAIDASGSMRSLAEGARNRMQVAIEAADMLINASGVLSHVGALAFHDDVPESFGPAMKRADVCRGLREFLRHEGGTEFAIGLVKCIDLIDGHPWGQIKRIIFLSDGEDMGDLYNLNREVQRCVDKKILIDTVAFGEDERGHATLRMMSEKTGGVFVYAKDAASLRKTFLALEAGARGLLGSGRKT